jgi:anti-anti-sigma factor
MGALVSALKTTRERGGQLKLCSIAPKVLTLIETANLNQVFEIFPNEASGLASFN